MKTYTIFHPLALSFYSKSLYQDVARHWRGIAATYLFLLLLIAWVPLVFVMHHSLSQFISAQGPGFVEQVPQVTVSQGELSIDSPSPYIIFTPREHDVLLIIDTSGRLRSLEDLPSNLLVTEHAVLLRKTDGQLLKYEFDQDANFSFDKTDVAHWLHALKLWLLPSLMPFLVLISFAYRLIQGLIFALVGMLFSRLLKIGLSYQQCLRLSLVALTPTIFAATLLQYFGIVFRNEVIYLFLLALIYLFFAIYSNSKAALHDEFETTN